VGAGDGNRTRTVSLGTSLHAALLRALVLRDLPSGVPLMPSRHPLVPHLRARNGHADP
jgi:hypothetical protein